MSVEVRERAERGPGIRGDRLHPHRSSRIYWHLTCLRTEVEAIIDRFLRADPRRRRLVDFGCGNMPYRRLFEPVVGEYLGCDLPGNDLADCVLQAPDVLPFDPGAVDVVLSSQVLEHCEEPQKYLGECRRVLAEDGLLILSTHGVWRYHPDPIDLWRWTSEGLRRTLRQAGFSVVHFRGMLGPAATGLQLWQDAVLPKWPAGLPATVFLRIMQNRIRAADLACPQEARDADASAYILVAQRGPEHGPGR